MKYDDETMRMRSEAQRQRALTVGQVVRPTAAFLNHFGAQNVGLRGTVLPGGRENMNCILVRVEGCAYTEEYSRAWWEAAEAIL